MRFRPANIRVIHRRCRSTDRLTASEPKHRLWKCRPRRGLGRAHRPRAPTFPQLFFLLDGRSFYIRSAGGAGRDLAGEHGRPTKPRDSIIDTCSLIEQTHERQSRRNATSISAPTSGKREDIGPRRRHDDAVTSNRHAFARRASANGRRSVRLVRHFAKCERCASTWPRACSNAG
jgi:hypothetical protein